MINVLNVLRVTIVYFAHIPKCSYHPYMPMVRKYLEPPQQRHSYGYYFSRETNSALTDLRTLAYLLITRPITVHIGYTDS
jgi:hypothetical protein